MQADTSYPTTRSLRSKSIKMERSLHIRRQAGQHAIAITQTGVERVRDDAGRCRFIFDHRDWRSTTSSPAALQSDVDRGYQQFLGDVSRGRGISPDRVCVGFDERRTIAAREAVSAGMIDRVTSFADGLQSKVADVSRRETSYAASRAYKGHLAYLERQVQIAQAKMAANGVAPDEHCSFNPSDRGVLRPFAELSAASRVTEWLDVLAPTLALCAYVRRAEDSYRLRGHRPSSLY